MVTVRNCSTSPSNFLTSYHLSDHCLPAQDIETFTRRKNTKKKGSYMSRRFMQHYMLDSHMDDVFRKVSLIRAT